MQTYQDYEDVYCPVSTRQGRRECIYRPTRENGTLAERFERFAREWDGRDAYNLHLALQVPMLSSSGTGLPLNVTHIYNVADSDGGWKSIAERYLGRDAAKAISQEKGRVIEGRSFPRRFDSSMISAETKRRICELSLLDYCCLNLPLPSVCRGKHYNISNGAKTELFCIVNKKGRIEPGIFPESRV